ncbi:hypothetical protein D3C72_2281600 [compost metagenome]
MPLLFAFTSPFLPVAVSSLVDAHTAVFDTSTSLPSSNVAVAISCTDCPTLRLRFIWLTSRYLSTSTVTGTFTVLPPYLAVT